MPWSIEERDGRYCVIKDDDGENEGCHDTEEQARAQMRALYASENRAMAHAPIESRAATVNGVDFPAREIEVRAVPYDEETIVEYRGELWRETVAPGAFDGVERRPNRIKAFRDHEAGAHMKGTGRTGLIGRVTTFAPDRPDGLWGTVRIAKTPLGDETLALADEGVLGVSVGWAVRGSDQVLNRVEMRRRIKRAFVDHIAFPDEGAYPGAVVAEVRSAPRPIAVDLPKLETPLLDDTLAWLEARGRRS